MEMCLFKCLAHEKCVYFLNKKCLSHVKCVYFLNMVFSLNRSLLYKIKNKHV